MAFRRRHTMRKRKLNLRKRRPTTRKVPRAPLYRRVGQFTPYKFKAMLLPNILVSTTAGSVQFIAPSGGYSEVGLAPFIPNVAGTGPNLGLPQPSGTGISGFIDFGFACDFRLSDLQNAAIFAGQYDAYRLDKVTVLVEYLSNSVAVNGAGLLPTLYLYNDQDDSNVPTSLQQITAKTGVRMIALGNKMKTLFSHNITPRTGTLVYNDTMHLAGFPSALATTKVEKPHAWLDCKNQADLRYSVPHYALKGWITDWESRSGDIPLANALRFTFKYHFSVRSPLAVN